MRHRGEKEMYVTSMGKTRQKGSMTSATSPIILKWDPKSLEIRTLTVERLLEPLVTQVTTLVNTSNKGPSGKKKGRSKKAHVLAASVEQATQNFLEKGDQIAKESQDLKEELVAAVEDVRKQGTLGEKLGIRTAELVRANRKIYIHKMLFGFVIIDNAV
ncbi:Catenin alpha-2 [Amazona aestiva]|uniref:Catenin alpha-2 n=1 Tax=Amazona aestiva TaxID=12930 RepID=A0A0Q3SEM6_AMAAE|nr:Catenin alpha-2 [Amazona aestiva]